jgi:hypothetical protein
MKTNRLREDELFYARLDGKHAKLDDRKDRGHFWMKINSHHGRDREYWRKFCVGFKYPYTKVKKKDV